MGKWDPFKVNTLPDEQRAEVIKSIAHESEETNRTKINSDRYNNVRFAVVVVFGLAAIGAAVVGFHFVDSWQEVKVKSLTPVVCPPPPPTPQAVPPAFDIRVVPIQPAPKSS